MLDDDIKALRSPQTKQIDNYTLGESITNKIWFDKQVFRFIAKTEEFKLREHQKIKISNNIEFVIDYRVIVYKENKFYNIKFSNEFADDIYIENGYICLDVASDWSHFNGYVIVEYTKK